MELKDYIKKRDFTQTKEPKEIECKIKNKKPIFVIHSHFAKNHHYDLRLEMSGVLKSWAVPKQPPLAKGEKRLAIQVEDHPLEYAKFKGIIPEGYGAGVVKIWDNGKYDLIENTSSKIIVEFHGKKLKGEYVLIKTSYGGRKNGWLFFKL